MTDERDRPALHPAGAAVARLLERSAGLASSLGVENARIAARIAESAELEPSAVFVALDLARLAGSASGELARVALVLGLLESLARGSTRTPVGTAEARKEWSSRLLSWGVGRPHVDRVEAMLVALASGGAPPVERKRGSASQLALTMVDPDAALPAPLLVPSMPGGRTAVRCIATGENAALALSRWADAEDAVRVALLGRRAALAPPETVLATLAAMPPAGGARAVRLTEEQQRAVATALRGPTAVITGGPGTGKTSIVVAMLRAFLRTLPDALPESIAVAAPTGKAADRMREAVMTALEGATDPRDLALAEALAPRTLHRLLGYQPEQDRFRHHAGSRLPQRLVIVDEASMIDTMLLSRLVDALGDDTVLVLLGDPDQLPSVGAGAVLRDLGKLAERHPAAVGAAHLGESHRMSGKDPAGAHVLSVAQAIGRGEVPRVVEAALTSGAWTAASVGRDVDGASLLASPPTLGPWLDHWLTSLALDRDVASQPFPVTGTELAEGDGAHVLAAMERAHGARLLVLTRTAGRRTSLRSVNEYLGARYARSTDRRPSPEPLPGEPVVVVANDYLRGIYNGDTGLVIATEVGGQAALGVAFAVRGKARVLPLLDIRHLIERAWALTVHRAQGSEHERVALLLPEEDVPRLATRELIYTAITRARRAVQVVGDPAILALAIARRQDRRTGLADETR